MSWRGTFFALYFAVLLLGVSVAFAADCTSSWAITSAVSADELGFSAALGDAGVACVNEASRVASFGSTQTACSISGNVLTESGTLSPGNGGGTFAYQWTRQPVGCTPPGTAASGSMGDYSTNAGLYTFVVGVSLMFALGFNGGLKR